MERLLSKSPEMSNSPITATKDARNLGRSLQTARLGNLRNLRPPLPKGVSSLSAISFSLGLVSSPSSSSMTSSSIVAAVVVVVNFLVGFLVPGLRVVVVVRLITGFFVVETGFRDDVGFLVGALVDDRVTGFLVVTLGYATPTTGTLLKLESGLLEDEIWSPFLLRHCKLDQGCSGLTVKITNNRLDGYLNVSKAHQYLDLVKILH
uniref:Uncharacterized protein n=1 Tax=Glossina brevipalpis TaxID=37001 RepID=A0A1A9W2G3_9MUSC